MNSGWWVYLCEKSGRIYVGVTTDVTHRIAQHKTARLLYRKGPVSKAEALKRERQLKGWKKDKKRSPYIKGPEKQMCVYPEHVEGSHVRGAISTREGAPA